MIERVMVVERTCKECKVQKQPTLIMLLKKQAVLETEKLETEKEAINVFLLYKNKNIVIGEGMNLYSIVTNKI